MEKKYIFIKPYVTSQGTIPQNTEMTIFRNILYVNGGPCMGAYASMLKNIIEDEDLHKEYLKDQIIHKNEF